MLVKRPMRQNSDGLVLILVAEEVVVGASMNCQFAWLPRLVAPCAWYKTPGSPVQVRTTLPALKLILTFGAGLTAGAVFICHEAVVFIFEPSWIFLSPASHLPLQMLCQVGAQGLTELRTTSWQSKLH